MLNYQVLIKKITSNKKKPLLVEDQFKKLETFYSIYFGSKSYLEDNSTQDYLIFQMVNIHFKTVSANDSNVLSLKS